MMTQRKYTQYWERYIGQSRKWVAVLVFDYGYPDISKIEFSMAGIARRYAAGQSIPRWITPREYIAMIGSRYIEYKEDGVKKYYSEAQRETVRQAIIRYVNGLSDNVAIVSGAAPGADTWAAQAARHRGLEVIEYPADWKRYGKQAGFIRNADIIKKADRVVAFWDEQSNGTRHSIGLAEKQGKPVEIINALKPNTNDLNYWFGAKAI